MKKIAFDTHGYVGADLSQLCMEAAFSAIREIFHLIDIDAETIDPAIMESIVIENRHFEHALQVNLLLLFFLISFCFIRFPMLLECVHICSFYCYYFFNLHNLFN